jgi:tetratricopeptide (TPR) repeat protein
MYDLVIKFYKECLGVQISPIIIIGSVAEQNDEVQNIKTYLRGNPSIKQLDYPKAIVHVHTVDDIGSAYESAGKCEYNLALEYYKKCLEMRKCIFEYVALEEAEHTMPERIDHPDIATTLNNIGRVYQSIDEYDLALQNYKKCWEMWESCFAGNAHPDVANPLYNIGVTYHSLASFDMALFYQTECLQMRRVLFKNLAHPDVATSLNSIEKVHQSVGNYNLALMHFEECFKMRNFFYEDDDHPDVVSNWNSISDVYHSLGNYDFALNRRFFYNEATRRMRVLRFLSKWT